MSAWHNTQTQTSSSASSFWRHVWIRSHKSVLSSDSKRSLWFAHIRIFSQKEKNDRQLLFCRTWRHQLSCSIMSVYVTCGWRGIDAAFCCNPYPLCIVQDNLTNSLIRLFQHKHSFFFSYFKCPDITQGSASYNIKIHSINYPNWKILFHFLSKNIWFTFKKFHGSNICLSFWILHVFSLFFLLSFHFKASMLFATFNSVILYQIAQ